MYHEEKTFTLRFTLEASFPDHYEGEEDAQGWVREWDAHIKPHLLKVVVESLRQHSLWQTRMRNRGKAPTDEIEIVLAREFTPPPLGPPAI